MTQSEKFRQLKRFTFDPQKKKWVFFGVFYGYPACCIEDFCKNDTLVGKLTYAQNKTYKGSGFIPCPTCARKILRGEITYESLITSRISSLPFPADERMEDTAAITDAVNRQELPVNKPIEL